jgi:hypothetical protein
MVLGAISASTNALYTDTFTGDGTETDYTLGITPVDLNAIEVYLNGLYQNVGTLTLAANVVTFATAPPSGVIIEIRSVGFLNSGGTLAPATLTGGTGISVVTNSPNNFTINNTLIDVSVSFNAPTGQSLTYTTPAPSSGQAGSVFPTTTFTVTDPLGNILSGTAVITGLPAGITSSQSYNNTGGGNILTITLNGVYPSTNSVGTNLVISNLTVSAVPLTVDYLVIAGGGGGGGSQYNYTAGGGGGAGGYRNSFNSEPSGGGNTGESTLTLSLSTPYNVTVGAGGGGGTPSANGLNGSNSIFSTIVSTGGGGGGTAMASAIAPASGGGSGGGSTSYANTPGTAATSIVQGYNGNTGFGSNTADGCGGGGGAGAIGGAGTTNTGGNGGTGLYSLITGTSTPRGGGGGAGTWNGGTAGSGGNGGGGNAAQGAGNGSPGTPNTGGGGGGGSAMLSQTAPYGGAGGSGIVILRYPSNYTISGLSGSTDTSISGFKITTFITGTGNITFS